VFDCWLDLCVSHIHFDPPFAFLPVETVTPQLKAFRGRFRTL
jgi:hypothetical protein